MVELLSVEWVEFSDPELVLSVSYQLHLFIM